MTGISAGMQDVQLASAGTEGAVTWLGCGGTSTSSAKAEADTVRSIAPENRLKCCVTLNL
jgi:hypothetical protein